MLKPRIGIIALMLALISAAFALNAQSAPIRDAFIVSNPDKKQIEIRVWIDKESLHAFDGATAHVSIDYPDGSKQEVSGLKLSTVSRDSYSSLTVPINPVLLWHPKTPNLYRLEAAFYAPNGAQLTSLAERFGMRTYENRNGRFYLNNMPFYVRAWGGETIHGCDKLDRTGALKRLGQARRYGFNADRHHSHVPPEVYLDVADELGVLVQMEIGGQIGTDPASEQFLKSKQDWVKMIERGRRHPSTFIYSMGNEIYLNDPGLIKCQNLLYDLAKEMDASAFVLNRSGSNPFNDDHGKYDLIERPIGEYEHVAEFAREAFMLYLRGDRKGRSNEFPIIAHEYPLVASYPNPELAYQYPEVPFWLKLTVENARKNGLEHLLPDFVRNSEKIQALCRKEMLEEARKFRELDGYSMLRFTDCVERVSGVVTDFADPKNVTAEEFLRTNGETILLCTWHQRSFWYGDTLKATLEISHHGAEAFSAPTCQWWLMNGPQVLAKGTFENISVNAVDVTKVGEVSVKIPDLPAPAKLTLRAALPDTVPLINNEWHFWAFPKETMGASAEKKILLWDPQKRLQTYREVYPYFEYSDAAQLELTEDPYLLITDSWQDSCYWFLERGGRIWIISDKSWHWPEEIGIFGLHITRFSSQAPPVFPELDEHCTKWLTICSNTEPRYGNSGTVIYPHPALRNFPNEGFCDLHFWPLIYRAKSLQLERFPAGTEPLIRAIDNFYRGRSKGYMVELGVGKGKVFVSTLNFTQTFSRAVATRYMFDQTLRYLTGPEWKPAIHISAEELRTMLADFAAELASRKPLIQDEMPARYTTRWKWLLDPHERIFLQAYEAQGVDEKRLDVHYEYAQTLWYFNAQPSDTLRWEFENQTPGDFSCTLHLASPLKNVTLSVQTDDREPKEVRFQGSDSWDNFIPVEVALPNLRPEKHRLKVSVADDAATENGRAIRIRELEFRAVAAPPPKH